LTVQDPINLATGAQLRCRGMIFGNLVANTAVAGWRLREKLIVAVAHPDNDIVTNAPVTWGGYKVANRTARRTLTKNTFIAARLESALSEKYQLVYGHSVPCRGLFVSLGWQQ
jgi:outer membrane cobalamin receptor